MYPRIMEKPFFEINFSQLINQKKLEFVCFYWFAGLLGLFW